MLKGYDLGSPTQSQPLDSTPQPADTHQVVAQPKLAKAKHATKLASTSEAPKSSLNAKRAEVIKPQTLPNPLDRLAKGGKRDRAAFEGEPMQLHKCYLNLNPIFAF